VAPTPSSPCAAAASMGGSRSTGSCLGPPDPTVLSLLCRAPTFRLAPGEAEFWSDARNPHKTAERIGESFVEFLKRAMLLAAPLDSASDLAWFLASYAHEAKFRTNSASSLALRHGHRIFPNGRSHSSAKQGHAAADLFYHAVAVLHSPFYRRENSGALRQDWPRIPLPACAAVLLASAVLGRQVAALLDTCCGEAGMGWVQTDGLRALCSHLLL